MILPGYRRAMPLPVVGITMGDPAGIGPEIVVRALNEAHIYEQCRPFVIGDVGTFERTVKGMDFPQRVRAIERVADASFQLGVIDVLQTTTDDLSGITMGEVQAAAGKAAVQCVIRGVELALAREIDVIATAPLNKDAMNQAGYHYAGHTELLAELTSTETYSLMLVAGTLRVVHVTTHVSMRRALELLSKDRVLRMIRLASQTAKELGVAKPRVGVSGFNCHAGENGLFGTEEIEHVTPAIEAARAEGIDATGPWPADTIFMRAADRNEFDIVVCMYHDQGHVAVKMRGLQEGVNTTAGLPIIRTSVDHGTAFRRAGQWRADAGSMIASIVLGAELAQRRFYSS
jgi:4-phospho-D-threonate 3-dehydrogenase / 4-phospho-D-erythronate 3-dehydrogenase